MKHPLLAGLFGIAILSLVTTAPAQEEGSSPPPLTPQKASKELKKAINSHLKFQKKDTNELVKEFCQALSELEDGLNADKGFAADDYLDAAINEMGLLLSEINDTANTVVNTINFDAEQLLIQLGSEKSSIPVAFLEGSCSHLDKALQKVRDTLDKATQKMRSKMKAFGKKAAKKQDLAMNSAVDSPEPVAIAPNPDEPAPAANKDLNAEASLSGSNGMLCLTGQYSGDPGVSISAEVTLNGMPFGQSATVSGCRWTVCFGRPGSSEGALPPGNYSIEVREFNVDGTLDTVTETFGVPGN
jgi:hypothetical protein